MNLFFTSLFHPLLWMFLCQWGLSVLAIELCSLDSLGIGLSYWRYGGSHMFYTHQTVRAGAPEYNCNRSVEEPVLENV